jgi:hypothetical protein
LASGSLAYYLIHNSDEWKWIGRVRNEIGISADNVFYQEFKIGIIYGPFRVTPKDTDSDMGIIFIVFNDGNWTRESSGTAAPKITLPSTETCK